MWPLARLHAQVRHVPYLLPRECTQGADSRRYQIELVASTVEQVMYLSSPEQMLVFKEERRER